jgi:tyrosine-specific transport protein
MQKNNRLIGGILLVAGTTIGAGMLALPVITGFAGFFPSTLLLICYWIYMTYTALLMLEVNLGMPKETNLITMAKRTLGRGGEIVSWMTFLFLLYSLTTAYIAGGGPIINDFVQTTTGITLPSWFGPIPLLLIFGAFVYKGTKSVDYVNRLLMAGLVIAFLALILFLTPHVERKLLLHSDWKSLLIAISIVATSFGFHIIIPSLTTYFQRDVPSLKKAIFIGSAIPLVVYIIWEFLTLGIIPAEGPHGIVQGYQEGANGAHLLTAFLGNSYIAMIARCFSFFAIITSFLGVSLSLSHFLADGFKIKPTYTGRGLIYLLTFLPPLLITLYDPRAFLSALEYAGAFGVVIILALLPALMVWRGRTNNLYASPYKAPGGKIALAFTIFISLSVIGLEVANKMGIMNFVFQPPDR